MAKRLVNFVVRGRGRFPLDMLRYDGCWPTRGEDSSAISASFSQASTIDVRLTGIGKPTEARWASFGWQVVEQGW